MQSQTRTSASRRARLTSAALGAFTAVLGMTVNMPTAAAAPCPDVEVVFARGTGEAPGVGGVGQAFVDSVRAQSAGQTVDVYPVDYPASGNFDDRMAFAQTVVDGIRDAGEHVQSTAANCPDTRIVLGGYSQGAVVAGFVTSASVPDGVPTVAVPAPLPPEVANHVAAVALFGTPSPQFLQQYSAPPIVIGPLYADKTTELCAPGDTICDGAPDGGPTIAHALYPVNGMVGEGATFAVDRL